MSEVLTQAVTWLEAGQRVALVSVTGVEGSTPRRTGPAMAVNADGAVVGSVSAGCVDGEAHALAVDALATGQAAQRRYTGPTETVGVVANAGESGAGEPGESLPADLADLGPTILCGGAMTLDVSPLTREDIPTLRAAVSSAIEARPLLLIYGAGDVAADLTRLAAVTGRRVVLVDQRAVFTSADRFPDADEVVVDRPERHLQRLLGNGPLRADTAIVVLSHEARIEDPVLTLALTSGAGYVGALGSRRTHARRVERLREQGVAAEGLARLHGPVGLDLGAVTSAETAVSILAEIIAVAHGGTGVPLSRLNGAIHGPSTPSSATGTTGAQL